MNSYRRLDINLAAIVLQRLVIPAHYHRGPGRIHVSPDVPDGGRRRRRNCESKSERHHQKLRGGNCHGRSAYIEPTQDSAASLEITVTEFVDSIIHSLDRKNEFADQRQDVPADARSGCNYAVSCTGQESERWQRGLQAGLLNLPDSRGRTGANRGRLRDCGRYTTANGGDIHLVAASAASIPFEHAADHRRRKKNSAGGQRRADLGESDRSVIVRIGLGRSAAELNLAHQIWVSYSVSLSRQAGVEQQVFRANFLDDFASRAVANLDECAALCFGSSAKFFSYIFHGKTSDFNARLFCCDSVSGKATGSKNTMLPSAIELLDASLKASGSGAMTTMPARATALTTSSEIVVNSGAMTTMPASAIALTDASVAVVNSGSMTTMPASAMELPIRSVSLMTGLPFRHTSSGVGHKY